MNLKSALVITVLLAIAAVPALADGQMATEAVKDVGVHSNDTPSGPAPVHQEIAYPQEFDGLSLGLVEVNFFEVGAASSAPTCEEIDGTPCSNDESCGSCYPHPVCPLTPCFCGYGVCQCDI